MTKKHKEISGGDNIQFKISQKYLLIQNQILIFVHKRMTMATKIKRRKMTRDELRAMMPKKLNKLGEWFFSNDEDKLYVEVKDMRAVLK